MGWASGSRLFRSVIYVTQKHVLDDISREEMYYELIDVFDGEDWDTQDECMGIDPAYDAALIRLHPDWFDA